MVNSAHLTVAVPRGALFGQTLDLFDRVGFDTDELRSNSRKLLFDSVGKLARSGQEISIITTRPSDVPTYVEYGAAQIGITGKDVLMERRECEVYEYLDLEFGGCEMVFATPQDVNLESSDFRYGLVKVATKYPNITRAYFAQTGRQVEVVAVKGSVELAPVVGLSAGIVDLTATGSTISANRLEVREKIATCTARLIVNSVAHRVDSEAVDEIADLIRDRKDPVVG